MRRLAALALFAFTIAVLLLGMAGAGGAEEIVSFISRDAIFLDDLLTADRSGAPEREITGTLSLPSTSAGSPVPAAVIMPTSSGPSELEWSTARGLNAAGIASLVIDSFGPRGYRTREERMQVTESALMADAYGALLALAKDPRIRAENIAIIGFSKGGTVALYATMNEIANAIAGPAGPRFAAHLAFYPWCGLTLLDQRTTGAPVMVHMGDRDNLASPELCRTLVSGVRRDDPKARVDLHIYPGASHAFNHPTLAWLPPLTVSSQNSGTCRIVETAPKQYREASTDQPLTHETYRAVLAGCIGHGGIINYSSDATAKAAALSHDFLDATLHPNQPAP
jgi:dienelactone hydrolase